MAIVNRREGYERAFLSRGKPAGHDFPFGGSRGRRLAAHRSAALGLLSLSMRLQQDRSPAESEALAELVDQIALMRKMERPTAVREHRERRRANGVLRNVEDPALFEVELLHEAV